MGFSCPDDADVALPFSAVSCETVGAFRGRPRGRFGSCCSALPGVGLRGRPGPAGGAVVGSCKKASQETPRAFARATTVSQVGCRLPCSKSAMPALDSSARSA